MRCLVTGGAGFIGSHLVEALVARGASVVVLDDLSNGRLRNLAELEARIRFIQGSVNDRQALSEAMDGAEIVFHLAAQVSVPKSIQKPWNCFDANIQGTSQVFETAAAAGVRRLIFSSSAAVYGSNSPPLKEGGPADPQSPYAFAKLAGENLGALYQAHRGLEFFALRYFNAFGPRQSAGAYADVITNFMANCRDGQPSVIHGDGLQTRDFIYVSDVVEANLRAASAACGAQGLFNVASGRAVSINELQRQIASLSVRPQPEPEYRPTRIGDLKHSLAAVEKAADVLGFSASVDLPEGLSRTWAWFAGSENGDFYQ